MAAFAIKSSAVRWMLETGIILSSFGSDRIAQQGLARLYVREQHRAFADLDAVRAFTGFLPRHRKHRRREVAGFRKVGAEMCATRILALQRGKRNDPADFDERLQIKPVMPCQIEPAIGVGDAG